MSASATFQYHVEVIDGIEIEKQVPDRLHALVQTYLTVWLYEHLNRRLQILPELNVVIGRDQLVPDIVVATRDALYVDGDLISPPVLAVEILSPGQRLPALFERADRLCSLSLHTTCWVLWPEQRRSWSYDQEHGPVEQTEVLVAHRAIAGERTALELAAMWGSLDEENA